MNRRLSALVVTFLFGLAQMGEIAHLAVVSHVECPEHGERMHLARAEPADPGAPSRVAVVSAAPEATPHEHDHCPVAAEPRGSLVTHLSPVEPPPPPLALPAISVPLPPESRAGPAFALYLIAPKQSPPA